MCRIWGLISKTGQEYLNWDTSITIIQLKQRIWAPKVRLRLRRIPSLSLYYCLSAILTQSYVFTNTNKEPKLANSM